MLPSSGFKTKSDYFQLYPEEDTIAEASVKTPLNSVDFTIFKSTFILAERDLGFSFAKFEMADQCGATEGELNFHKIRSTKTWNSESGNGNGNRNENGIRNP